MSVQNPIFRTLSQPESVARLERMGTDPSLTTRAAWARATCAVFGFFDAHGRAQVSTCSRALSKRADRGAVTLPMPRPCTHPSPRDTAGRGFKGAHVVPIGYTSGTKRQDHEDARTWNRGQV